MDLSDIDVYIERKRRSCVVRALEQMTEEQNEMFWAATGRREPDLRRPITAVARWMTAVSGVDVSHYALQQWLQSNG
jgi:hypothetical protein